MSVQNSFYNGNKEQTVPFSPLQDVSSSSKTRFAGFMVSLVFPRDYIQFLNCHSVTLFPYSVIDNEMTVCQVQNRLRPHPKFANKLTSHPPQLGKTTNVQGYYLECL
jgi:hypothetical protein